MPNVYVTCSDCGNSTPMIRVPRARSVGGFNMVEPIGWLAITVSHWPDGENRGALRLRFCNKCVSKEHVDYVHRAYPVNL